LGALGVLTFVLSGGVEKFSRASGIVLSGGLPDVDAPADEAPPGPLRNADPYDPHRRAAYVCSSAGNSSASLVWAADSQEVMFGS
jgi:hypothetical protein